MANRRATFALALGIAAASSALADSIVMKDGRRFSGRVLESKDGRVSIAIGAAVLSFSESQIERIDSESESDYYSNHLQSLLDEGKIDEAQALLLSAEQAGADEAILERMRQAIRAKLIETDPLKNMKPEARQRYDMGLLLLDRGLVAEAADQMHDARLLDPGNLEILRQCLDLDFALFMKGTLPIGELEKQARAILAIAPEDERARETLKLATAKEQNEALQREQAIEALYNGILKAYEGQKIDDQLLRDISRLKYYSPDNEILIKIVEIEKAIRPTLDMRRAMERAKAERAAAEAAAKEAEARKKAQAAAEKEKVSELRASRNDDRQKSAARNSGGRGRK
ncbi:MAG: hypothetical protein BWZ10_01499 [candidate division BRC1 bacterium ADurb.BinA364]|nr:MAG: hypothetical protein BWZ10_01499 [candidate division BRC1 bacterium ADurb.BinA364]